MMKLNTLILFVFALTINTKNAQKELNLFGNLTIRPHEVREKQLILVDTLGEDPFQRGYFV